MKILRISVMVVVSIFVLESTLFSGKPFLLYSGVEGIRDSYAYRQFRLRETSDFSKLVYLIDRFGTADIQIIYDNHYFKATFAARIARWFLKRNYRKETPQEWIMRWCNTSIPAGNLIWVKLSDGKFRLAREILLEELAALDQTIHQDMKTAEASIAAVEGIIPSSVPAVEPSRLAPENQPLAANPPSSSPTIAS